jgi:serine/threonine-protein kinase RsbW
MVVGTAGMDRRIGRQLMSLVPVQPAGVPRHVRPSSSLPVDACADPCVGCGRPSMVAVTLFGDVNVPHCAACWPAVAALIEARGDRVSYTSAARSVLAARRGAGDHPPCTRDLDPEAPGRRSRVAGDPDQARVRPRPPTTSRKPMSLPAAALASDEPVTPMYWRRAFSGEPVQAGAARAFVAHLLAGYPSLDDVLLALDELAVNAIRHTGSGRPGGTFIVAVHRDAAGVTVSVTDQGGPTEPRVQFLAGAIDPIDLAECGRGLLTATALATAWFWSGTPCSRTVHATFAVPRLRHDHTATSAGPLAPGVAP